MNAVLGSSAAGDLVTWAIRNVMIQRSMNVGESMSYNDTSVGMIKQRRHRRGRAVGLAMAAGAVLAAALIPVATAPAACADNDGGASGGGGNNVSIGPGGVQDRGGASVGGGNDLGIGPGGVQDGGGASVGGGNDLGIGHR